MRNHYGRVYRSSWESTGGQKPLDKFGSPPSGVAPLYRAVVWSGRDGRILWQSMHVRDRDAAFAEMQAAALLVGGQVDLWKWGHDGNVFAETVGVAVA